jgi:hypothetical protein
MVPGRGYDPASFQNTTLIPIELVASYDLFTPASDKFGLSAGIGYGLFITRSEVQASAVTTTENAIASALVIDVRGLLPLGPGAAMLDVRWNESHADLGALSAYTQGTFSGLSVALGYALDF